jgi:PilZ domain
MTENRRDRRQRVLKSGKISFSNGSFVVDCVIRNLSQTGAQLKVPTSVAIPDHFDFIEAGGKTRRAAVAWRRGDLMGVRFES